MSYQSRIVITDDEIRMTDSLKILLGNKGYDIETFHNGSDTLNYLGTHECDLVLMDVMMPVMNGFDALSYVANHHPDVPVILMTGQSSIDSAIRSLRGGAYDYLCKPFEYDELIKKVDNALSHRRLLREKNLIRHQLQSTEARYQYLVHNSPDIIFTLGAGNEFVFVTDKIKNCTSTDSQSLLDRNFSTIVHHQDVDKVMTYLKEVRSGKVTKDLLEFRIKCESCGYNETPCSGSHPEMEMNAVAMSNGAFTGDRDCSSEIYGIMRDITQRRRDEEEKRALESQLRQAQKMEAIGTLAGGIAHDFNNILSPIMGYAELTLHMVSDKPKVQHYTEQMLQAAKRAKDLVKQILAFSRKAEQEKKPLVITPIVEEVVRFMRASLPTTIEIKQTIDETTDAIMADPTQMNQVLMNLCTNAGHAMKETGGTLEIGLREVMIGKRDVLRHPSLKAGPHLQLFVGDTGHGISKAHLGRIFDPYFTTKRQGEGTGLGLAVVHGIIKEHGGEISVYSEEGKGTVFIIHLPLIEKKAEPEAVLLQAMPMGKGETILFIDDEEMVVNMSKELLEELGYAVIAETDPVRAVEVFKSNYNNFDIVITDKTMPHMTGFDIIRKIRDIRHDIPVMICSGFQAHEDMEKLKSLGISRFIAKPISERVFAKAIRDALDKNM